MQNYGEQAFKVSTKKRSSHYLVMILNSHLVARKVKLIKLKTRMTNAGENLQNGDKEDEFLDYKNEQ